jgi:hypothetical protein
VSASTVAGAVVARRRRDPDWPLRERRQPGTRGFDHEKAYIAVRKRVAKGERVMPACAAVAAETGATKGAVWQVVLASREGDPQWPTDKVRMGAPATFDHDKAAKKVAQRMAKGESVTAACRAVGDEMGVKPASVYNAVRKQRAAA